MVELPPAHVVQIDIRRNGLNLFDIRCNKVDIVDRAEQNIVKRCVMRHELNGGHAGARLNIYLANCGSIVALLITDSKFHGVNAVCKNAISNGHDAVLKGAGNFNAVHINLCRGRVQAGGVVFFFIGNRCTKGDRIRSRLCGCSSCEGRRIAHCCVCPANIAEHGRITVINGGGIIHRDVVQIHNDITVLGFIVLMIIVVRTAITVIDVHIKHHPIFRNAPISAAQVKINIVPARLVVLCNEAAVPVTAIVDEGCRAIVFVVRLHGAVLVALGNLRQKHTPVQRLRLNGEINPHADAGGILKVNNFIVVHAKTGIHVAGFRCDREVCIEFHGVGAAVDLTVLCRYEAAIAGGDNIVVIACCNTLERGNIAVLKVPENDRALAEVDSGIGAYIRAGEGRRKLACSHAAVSGGEAKTVDRADSGIFKGEGKV